MTDPFTINEQLGRELSELIGAVSLYLGQLGSPHKDDKERLQRAMTLALRSEAFRGYMDRRQGLRQ